jgi:hypothetical protein
MLQFADIKASLLQKYDDLPDGWSSLQLNIEKKKQMTEFYKQYEPEKIPEVCTLLANFEVNMALEIADYLCKMFFSFCNLWSPPPLPPLTMLGVDHSFQK